MGVVAGWGAYTQRQDIQFSVSLGVAVFFGLLTVTGLIYAIRSVQKTRSLTEDVKSLVKGLVLPIDDFAHFVEVATKIIKAAKENDDIITLSVTPALGEVLSPILHMNYKIALAEMVSGREISVTFYHPTCENMLDQLNRWVDGKTEDDTGTPVDLGSLIGNLESFLSDIQRATNRGKGKAKSIVLEGISIPLFLVVLSREEIVVCVRPERPQVKREDFKGFHTKSQNIKEMFRKAIIELEETSSGETCDIRNLLEAVREARGKYTGKDSSSSISKSLPG